MQITITNGTITKISETLTATSGYVLPGTITVSPVEALHSYDRDTGVVELTNLTAGNTTVTATAISSPDFLVPLLNITGLAGGVQYQVKVRVSDSGSPKEHEENESTPSTWTKS